MKSFNKIIIIGVLLVLVNSLGSCVKDIGNYDYRTINEVNITGIDSVYVVTRNDSLKISPSITYSMDMEGDTSNYEYSWLRINVVGISSGIPQVFGKSANLNGKISADEGSYECAFRVKDKKTGVWKEKYFILTVTNDIYEGWFALSEISNERSRLDMLSYKQQLNDYQFLKEILGVKNPKLVLDGRPNFLRFINSKFLSMGTSKLANMVSADNLVSKPIPDFPQSFITGNNEAIGNDIKLYGVTGQKLIWNNGKIFANNSNGPTPATFQEITKFSDGVSFRASRFVSNYDGLDNIFFNEDKTEFVWHSGFGASQCFRIDNEEIQAKAAGKKLLYMKRTSYNQGDTFAVLKDTTNNKVYLMLFTRAKLNYFQEILHTPIANAEFFEVSNELGYLYYTVGSKLYAYDFNTSTHKEMADYGLRKISLLKFNTISFASINKTPRYEDINRSLCVGTYLEGALDDSGTLDIYQVPPALGLLVKKESYSGFGKLKDITYRAR